MSRLYLGQTWAPAFLTHFTFFGRYALDPQGRNSGLLNALSSLNSRLVSPQQVQHLLQEYGASPLSNDELAAL